MTIKSPCRHGWVGRLWNGWNNHNGVKPIRINMALIGSILSILTISVGSIKHHGENPRIKQNPSNKNHHHPSTKTSNTIFPNRCGLFMSFPLDFPLGLGDLPLFQALQHGFLAIENVGRTGEGGALAGTVCLM